MDITLLNGIPEGYAGGMNGYVEKLVDTLRKCGHKVNDLSLKDLGLKYCTGCFGCFVKTPGLCLIMDDADSVCRAFIQSNLVLMISPVIMGFTSALLKRAQDRIIPLALPYVEVYDGEMHHPARYEKMPLFALLIEKGPDTDDEDLDIIRSTYDRIAINAHTKMAFTCLTDYPIEEVCHAIDRI
jgi:hypothetical protein